jgi:molybdate transport system regulatory protein
MSAHGHQRGMHPRFKLWISSGQAEGVFGDGKWRLLAAIEREGSLRAASQSLGISYRKAWGDLQKAERCLGVTFLQRRRGGSGGGQTPLTEAGRRWLAAYSRFRGEMEAAMAQAYDSHIGTLTAGGGSEE